MRGSLIETTEAQKFYKVAIYLRKSRADEELERELGDHETLARHRNALLRFAKEKGLNIIKIHEELVSGELIIHRPAMLELLREVEQGLYDAVLVMDQQRLGRGDMQDQGLILKTFKDSNTKIMTPKKTYDLNDEFDEEYSEFEAFMSRKELKMITRRMQGGRVRSVEEGNYIGTRPPYGYLIQDEKHGRTLTPHPEQADVVKLIFDLYVNKSLGGHMIAHELNKLGYKTYSGSRWENTAILAIIKNPVYIGKVTWKKVLYKKSTDPNKKRTRKLNPQSDWIVAEGKHEAIVDEDLFNKAQEILSKKYHVPYQVVNGQRNPLAGLVYCKVCGAKMIFRPVKGKEPRIMCTKKCGNISTKFKLVETKILDGIDRYIKDREKDIQLENSEKNKRGGVVEAYLKALESLEHSLGDLRKQKLNIHDLLEKNVYDIETFLERSKYISEKSEETEKNISELKRTIEKEMKLLEDQHSILPNLKKVLSLYKRTKSPEKQCDLMQSILDRIEYIRESGQLENDFKIILHFKLLDLQGLYDGI